MNKQALIVIDIQNEYFEEGKLTLSNPVETSLTAQKVLQYFRQKELPIAHIQHLSANPEAIPMFVEGTNGAEIHKNVQPLEGENVFKKYYPNSFKDTSLLDYLKENNVTEVVIVGMMTQMCVDSTTRAAFDLGFKCTVISDACDTLDLEFDGKKVKAEDVQTAFFAAISFIFAEVKKSEDFLNS